MSTRLIVDTSSENADVVCDFLVLLARDDPIERVKPLTALPRDTQRSKDQFSAPVAQRIFVAIIYLSIPKTGSPILDNF